MATARTTTVVATGGCTRRALLCGATAVAGAGLLSACAGSSAEDADPGDSAAGSPAPPTARESAVTPSAAGLAAVADVPDGSALSVKAPDGTPVLLVRTSATAVVGFSAVCPHQGCTVAPDGSALACPCHGSRFDLAGQVTNGPARRALTPFAVAVVDGTVRTA